MNLFIIPTWYPNERDPVAGVFTREQAEAIAQLAPEVRVLVSAWGYDAGALSLREPSAALAALAWRLRRLGRRTRSHNCVTEIGRPALTWSGRLPFGGTRQLLAIHRRNLRLALRDHGWIDLLHAHVSYPAGYVASILSREFGMPYVLTEHMSPFPFERLMRDGRPIPEIDRAFAGAAATVAVSPSLAQRIASFGYSLPRVIPNLVDERRFVPARPAGGKFAFLTLCGITEQKGVDHLLQAIAAWDPPAESFEFRIAGDGPLRSRYQALAAQLGVDDRVRWLGAVSPELVPGLFAQSHAFVMTSRHETFGVVYAEALACGLPVVATRSGGPDSIVNDRNGLLVEVGDVEAIAQALQQVAGDRSSYDAAVIREDFMQRFSRGAVVRQLLSLYRSVLDSGPTAA